MVKPASKRRKLSKKSNEIQPLGVNLLTDDASKDDEERRLESMLFGTKFKPGKNDGILDEDEKEGALEGGQEMNNLMDTDLFFVDDGVGTLGQDVSVDGDPSNSDMEDEQESEIDSDGSESDTSRPLPSTTNPLLNSSKAPAWVDGSDPPLVSLAAPRLRKLRDAPTEVSLSGREYETRLRRQYERINPEPSWAAKARKSRRAVVEGDEDTEDNDLQDLLSSSAGILAPSNRKIRTGVALPTGTLKIERLRDANQVSQASGSGEVKVVAFHPSERVPVLCVGTADRRIRLYNIDGHTSPLLQTLHIPSLPLTSQSSASFHPLGSSILLTGPRPFFYTHDLQTGVTSRHARGLWGTTFSSINDTNSSRMRKRGRGGDPSGVETGGGGNGEGMEVTAFSPHTGDILAVAGRGGYVHLVDWKSGAGQVVGSLKCGGGGGGVRAVWWAPEPHSPNILGGRRSNNPETRHLAVLSGDAEIYLWDIGERRCIRRWKDEGGFRGAGKVMAGSAAGNSGGWLAVGSNTGFVNVYGSDSFADPNTSTTTFSTNTFGNNPKPIKTIGNLTTCISTLRFNHDAQIMAMASREKKDAMRLIHLPSMTSFANWPTSSTPLGHVTAVDFSARSEYLAVGNTKGRVLLYHLTDYGV